MTSLARALLAEIAADPEALAEFAQALSPYLPQSAAAEDGWLDSAAAAAYAGCSIDSLKKAMAARELYFELPGGPHGKAWFTKAHIDAWRRGEAAQAHLTDAPRRTAGRLARAAH